MVPWGVEECGEDRGSWGAEGEPRSEEEVACHDGVLRIAGGMGREEEGSIGGRNGSYKE